MSALFFSARILSAALPRIFAIRRCFRWSHFSLSLLHVSSATRSGAITRTRETSNRSHISSSIAVRVMTVLPSPISRKRPAASCSRIKETALF